MSFTRTNASAATLSKNRTPMSVVNSSGMCATCVDGCIGMCEIGKSAYRGHEVIYPQPFGIITSANDKQYPVDLSHFTIIGGVEGAQGVEADSDVALFSNVDLEPYVVGFKGRFFAQHGPASETFEDQRYTIYRSDLIHPDARKGAAGE